ncbi:hypothetical protein M2161_003375 [Streptomyces sp. SAI-133]|nr:hypothetical protein [Streptomyces sp. SAI-133]
MSVCIPTLGSRTTLSWSGVPKNTEIIKYSEYRTKRLVLTDNDRMATRWPEPRKALHGQRDLHHPRVTAPTTRQLGAQHAYMVRTGEKHPGPVRDPKRSDHG